MAKKDKKDKKNKKKKSTKKPVTKNTDMLVEQNPDTLAIESSEEQAGKSIVELVVENAKKIAKEDFGTFSAIVAVAVSVGVWIIKSAWYAYMSGKFSVYKIDRCYINTDRENIFLEIIQLISICIVWFMINYIYYKLLTMEDDSRFSWKKMISIIVFWGIEMLLVIAILISSNNNIYELFNGITIGEIFGILFILFLFCFLINIFAIEFHIEKMIKKHKKKNEQEHITENERSLKNKILFLIVLISVELILISWSSYKTEQNRTNYKLIMIQMDESAESDFVIEYGKEGNKYEVYPISYENEELYIVTRLVNHEGKISIDYNYQKIMEKEGQEIIYIENIYDIQ